MAPARKTPATGAAAATATLEKLTERFPVEDHKQNPRGFTYLAIEKVVGRWNEVLGSSWDLFIENVNFALLPGVTFGNRNPKPGAFATVQVRIEALIEGRLVSRGGVGGDFGAADDVDKLVKTALAEAIKKASNEFGVGLYLWDEEERALIESAQQQGMTGLVQAAPVTPIGGNTTPPPNGDFQPVTPDQPFTITPEQLDELKNRVADLAALHGIQRTGPAIAAHFGVPVEQLQDPAFLQAVLEANQPVTG